VEGESDGIVTDDEIRLAGLGISKNTAREGVSCIELEVWVKVNSSLYK